MELAVLFLAFIVIVSLVLVVLLSVAYPIWAIIDCAIDRERSQVSKTVWIALMVIIWPMASFAYGLFSARKNIHRVISGTALGVIVVFILGTTVVLGRAIGLTKQTLQLAHDQMDQVSTVRLTDDQRGDVKRSLIMLKSDLKEGMANTEKNLKILMYTEYFRSITNDREITVEEYHSWMKKYNMIDAIELEDLRDIIPAPAQQPSGHVPAQPPAPEPLFQ